MTRVAGEWLDAPATHAVTAMLTRAGYQALFVGGCVRNALLGAPVNDIDIATDARPDQVAALAEAAGLRAVPTGAEHGTMTVVSQGIPHEVTTFRRDVETDGRRAVVAFSRRIEEDAARRDFTMNALYARPDGTLEDPLGGYPDLEARRVRFILDPAQRIREDYLRILRFFRFHAWYGDPEGGLDPEGLAACAALSVGIDGLSRERIGAEMIKLLAAPDPAPSVAAMVHAGVLLHALPGADAKALPVLIHLEEAAGAAPDSLRRLACLGGEDPAEALRLSRAQARRAARLREAALEQQNPAAMGYRLGADDGRDAWLIRAALIETPLMPADLAAVTRGAGQSFPVSPQDLMPGRQGAELGAALAQLEQRWIDSDFTLSKADLIATLD